MVYLDNAATSFPKPDAVATAVNDYITNIGRNINRGGYGDAHQTAETVRETRELINEMFHGFGPSSTIFTPGNTYSLNYLIKGLARPGDKFLISGMEHNSVYRPVHQLEEAGIITVGYLPCNENGELIMSAALQMIDENVRALIVLHASNVSGTLFPIEELGKRCKETGTILLVDAAQTAGRVDIDMKGWNISGLAIPGHKAMMGPQGIGVMLVDPLLALDLDPIIAGGTGSFSELADMPTELPDRFESGTLNLPGIFGLNAAVKWLNENHDQIRETEARLTEKFIRGIKRIDGVRLVGLDDMSKRVPVVSISFIYGDNDIAAYDMERSHGIQTRSGLHCSPLAHKSLGTFPKGSVRFSIGPFNTEEDIDTALRAIRRVAIHNSDR
jgi:cysteine desulfurase family protein